MTNEEFYKDEIECVAKITNDFTCAYLIIAKLIGKVDIDCDDFKDCQYCHEACYTWLNQEHKEEEKQDRQESVIEHLLKTYQTECLHGVYQNDNYIELTIHNVNKEYFINNNINLLDTYKKPKIKLTQDEYIIFKNIDKEFEWIARDEDGCLYIYNKKPYKCGVEWENKSLCYNISAFIHLFKFIKWQDEEPRNIQKLLENCEVIEDD